MYSGIGELLSERPPGGGSRGVRMSCHPSLPGGDGGVAGLARFAVRRRLKLVSEVVENARLKLPLDPGGSPAR
jgi:hypothetical protein